MNLSPRQVNANCQPKVPQSSYILLHGSFPSYLESDQKQMAIYSIIPKFKTDAFSKQNFRLTIPGVI